MPVTRRVRGESGNVAVLVLVMFTAILGVGAVVIDVGALYVEGRQLQNGAENGALAVAETCVTVGTCDPSEAAPLADANAGDGAATVAPGAVCGTAPGLPACPSGTGGGQRFDCRPQPLAPGVPFVEVHPNTRNPANEEDQSEMPPMLARLVGVEDGTTVGACARVAYGAPTALTSDVPLVISYCQWKALTDAAGLADPPPYPPFPTPASEGYFDPTSSVHNPASQQVRIWTKGSAQAGTCSGPAGSSLSGGFGWVDQVDSGCEVATNTDGTFPSDTGASGPTDCIADVLGQLISVPVYDFASSNGNTGYYTIMGYAAFYLTGYNFQGNSNWGPRPDHPLAAHGFGRPCTASEGMCISGFLSAELSPATGGTIGGPSMGVTVIRMVG